MLLVLQAETGTGDHGDDGHDDDVIHPINQMLIKQALGILRKMQSFDARKKAAALNDVKQEPSDGCMPDKGAIREQCDGSILSENVTGQHGDDSTAKDSATREDSTAQNSATREDSTAQNNATRQENDATASSIQKKNSEKCVDTEPNSATANNAGKAAAVCSDDSRSACPAVVVNCQTTNNTPKLNDVDATSVLPTDVTSHAEEASGATVPQQNAITVSSESQVEANSENTQKCAASTTVNVSRAAPVTANAVTSSDAALLEAEAEFSADDVEHVQELINSCEDGEPLQVLKSWLNL